MRFTDVKRYTDEKKWEDEIDWFEFPLDKMVLVRCFGDVQLMARHWIPTLSGKRFPIWCPRFDHKTQEFNHERACSAHADFDGESIGKATRVMFVNAIIRSLQERGDNEPVKGLMLPHTIMDDLTQIAQLIKADPGDDDKGVDLAITKHAKAVGNKKWSIQRADRTPLTPEERRYRSFDFATIMPDFSDEEVAAQYAKNMREAMARHKYYVVQERPVPADARDPYKYFRADAKGKPRNEFAVLVDYDNAKSGRDNTTYRGGGSSEANKSNEEILYDEDETTSRRRFSNSTETNTRRAVAARDDVDDERGVHDTAGTRSAESSRTTETTASDDTEGGRPDCYGNYEGIAKCAQCNVRGQCIDVTDDSEEA